MLLTLTLIFLHVEMLFQKYMFDSCVSQLFYHLKPVIQDDLLTQHLNLTCCYSAANYPPGQTSYKLAV